MSFNTSESALLSHISNMNLSLKASSFSSVPKKRSQPSSTSGTSKNTRQGTVSPVLDCQPTPEISGRTENHRTESALVGHIGNMNLSFGSLSFPSVPKAQPPASRTSGRSNDIPRDTMTHAEASEKSSGISGSQAAHYDKPCHNCSLQDDKYKKEGGSYPCIKMPGRATSCYACRMRKKTCNVDCHGDFTYRPLEHHPVDKNESSCGNKYFQKWMRFGEPARVTKRQRRQEAPVEKSKSPEAASQPPTPGPSTLPDASIDVPAVTSTTPPFPRSIESLDPGLTDTRRASDVATFPPVCNFIGGSESMHRALEFSAAHWNTHGQLPSNEEFQRMLDLYGGQTQMNPIQPRVSTSGTISHFEPQLHGAEMVGIFMAKEGRIPTEEEMEGLATA